MRVGEGWGAGGGHGLRPQPSYLSILRPAADGDPQQQTIVRAENNSWENVQGSVRGHGCPALRQLQVSAGWRGAALDRLGIGTRAGYGSFSEGFQLCIVFGPLLLCSDSNPG